MKNRLWNAIISPWRSLSQPKNAKEANMMADAKYTPHNKKAMYYCEVCKPEGQPKHNYVPADCAPHGLVRHAVLDEKTCQKHSVNSITAQEIARDVLNVDRVLEASRTGDIDKALRDARTIAHAACVLIPVPAHDATDVEKRFCLRCRKVTWHDIFVGRPFHRLVCKVCGDSFCQGDGWDDEAPLVLGCCKRALQALCSRDSAQSLDRTCEACLPSIPPKTHRAWPIGRCYPALDIPATTLCGTSGVSTKQNA